MHLGRIFGKIAPVMALAAAIGLAGCDDIQVEVNGDEGVPLAELDTSGDAPDEVALISSDMVVITSGETFSIEVEGTDEAKDRLRFSLEGGTLAISREDGSWSDDEAATINVTMPPPNELVMIGSGRITSDAMSNDAEINVIGSGSIEVASIAAEDLSVTMTGNGTLSASGRAEKLDLNIIGSGSVELSAVTVEEADVSIVGSGSGSFASNGRVDANVIGPGTVTVTGTAMCTINAIGSGRLVCDQPAVED